MQSLKVEISHNYYELVFIPPYTWWYLEIFLVVITLVLNIYVKHSMLHVTAQPQRIVWLNI